MIPYLLAPLFVAIAVLILYLAPILKTAYFTPLHKVPGPWFAPFTNLRLKAANITGHRVYYVDDLHHKYGPVVRIAPTEIVINDVSVFREIHRIGGFNKSVWYQQLSRTTRPGVFAMTDPKQHASRRKLFARAFSKTFLRQHWEPLVFEKAELAVSRMKEELAIQKISDVMKWWIFLATDVSTHLMFGESFRCLETGEVSIVSCVLRSYYVC